MEVRCVDYKVDVNTVFSVCMNTKYDLVFLGKAVSIQGAMPPLATRYFPIKVFPLMSSKPTLYVGFIKALSTEKATGK